MRGKDIEWYYIKCIHTEEKSNLVTICQGQCLSSGLLKFEALRYTSYVHTSSAEGIVLMKTVSRV